MTTVLARYRKTIFAGIGTALTWAGTSVVPTNGHVTVEAWYALAVAVATTYGVFSVTNEPLPKEPGGEAS